MSIYRKDSTLSAVNLPHDESEGVSTDRTKDEINVPIALSAFRDN